MATVNASCMFCRVVFLVGHRDIRRKNLHHHCMGADRHYKAEKMKEWNRKNNRIKYLPGMIIATCLYCHDEFRIRPDRGQTTHGCKEAKAARKADYNKKYYKGRVKRKPMFAFGVRIKDNLHPCPQCGVVMTANRYRCHACWELASRSADVENIIAWGAGESRRVSRRGNYDHAF